MIPTNRFLDYSVSQNKELGKRAEEFLESFTLSTKKLKERQGAKLKVEGDTTEDNSIWIDPSIKVQYEKMKTAELPLHAIFDIYDAWFDQLFKLVVINEHRLHRKAIQKHITEIIMICATFQEILQAGAMGLSRPLPPSE